MPNQAQHEDQAQRNETFFQSLDRTVAVNREWIVTAAFYAALHWIEAYFDNRHGLHFESHRARNDAVTRFRLPVWAEYIRLYRASRQARYDLYRFAQQEVEDLINLSYKPVKDFVQNVLHPPPPSTP
ncbi:hypothetical protein HYR99_23675 [Candidatus Poribacteria bacterium]|nr:hypothetical protein [Candidatus Poribacteria bacterium]